MQSFCLIFATFCDCGHGVLAHGNNLSDLTDIKTKLFYTTPKHNIKYKQTFLFNLNQFFANKTQILIIFV